MKNVIILHTDQQRYDSMGCCGNPYAVTPNLDRLGEDGTIFTRHIISNPICSPSRASLLTGLYPPGHNLWHNGIALARKEYAQPESAAEVCCEPRTMADLFAAAGYDTVSFGKLHLTPWLGSATFPYPECRELWRQGGMRNWHGPYYGFRHVELALGHGDDAFHEGHYARWLQDTHPELYQNVKHSPESYVGDLVSDLYPLDMPVEAHHSMWLADKMCEYIDGGANDGQPFFAFVGFPDPHHPFSPCRETFERFKDAPVLPIGDPDGKGVEGSALAPLTQNSARRLSDYQKLMVARTTYAMVYQIDLAVGRILDKLESAGLADDTIVVFTSDHGDFLGDHNLVRKAYGASDVLVRVPFLLRAPGSDLPSRVDTPMSNCDVLPTLAALAGVPDIPGLDGEDIAKVIRQGVDHQAFVHAGIGEPESTNHTVYDSTHRLTWYPKCDYVELFDHSRDSEESENVAGLAEYRPVVEELKSAIAEQLVQTYNPILGRVTHW